MIPPQLLFTFRKTSVNAFGFPEDRLSLFVGLAIGIVGRRESRGQAVNVFRPSCRVRRPDRKFALRWKIERRAVSIPYRGARRLEAPHNEPARLFDRQILRHFD